LNDNKEKEKQDMKKWLIVAVILLVPVLGFAADTKEKQPTAKITDINKLGKLTNGYYVSEKYGNTSGVRLDFRIFDVKLPPWLANLAYIFLLPCTTLSFAVMPVIRFSFPIKIGIAFT
jgi:hypothetical protein